MKFSTGLVLTVSSTLSSLVQAQKCPAINYNNSPATSAPAPAASNTSPAQAPVTNAAVSVVKKVIVVTKKVVAAPKKVVVVVKKPAPAVVTVKPSTVGRTRAGLVASNNNNAPATVNKPSNIVGQTLYDIWKAYLTTAVATVKALGLINLNPTNNIETECLGPHNTFRTIGGRGSLSWDQGLVNSAQAWANHLAANRLFEHSHNTDSAGRLLGENLYEETNTNKGCGAAVLDWFNEFPIYTGEAVGQGPFEQYGHFTELMTPQVTRVGCAFANQAGNTVIWVCQYDVCQLDGAFISLAVPARKPFGL